VRPAYPPPPPRVQTTGRPPRGTPYHRLGHTDRYQWWKPLLALLLAGAAYVIVSSCVVIPSVIIYEELNPGSTVDDNPVLDDALFLLSIAVALPAVWLGVQVVEGRSLGWVSSVCGRLRWRWLGLTAAAILPIMVTGWLVWVQVGLHLKPHAEWPSAPQNWPTTLSWLAITVALVPVQAAAEEYVYRGFLLQWIGSYLRNPVFGVAITTVLFVLGHSDLRPYRLVTLTAFGVVAAVLTLYTGGLEAAIVLHIVNNLATHAFGLLAGPLPGTDGGANMPWWMVGVELGMLAVVLATVLLLAWLQGVERIAPLPEPPQEPAAEPDLLVSTSTQQRNRPETRSPT
jgi:uncharacterized protein